ncbi:MAG: nucleotide exchange factor GrpE, partial [Flavobacteriales bacterium]|nr:nucleotide exchange factor GrpE [Flavobacteriales bacterium]
MKEENNTIDEQEGNIENSTFTENETDNNTQDQERELSDIEKKDLEIQALNDKYIRLYSEFDNFRRRTQKEKLELYKTAGEDIFKSLLPVMDDFERAKKSMEETKNYDSLKEGIDLIYNKFLNVFKSNG